MIRRIGNVTQSRFVIAPLLNVTCSCSASLTPMHRAALGLALQLAAG